MGVLGLVASALVGLLAMAPVPAEAQSAGRTVQVSGHGFGHGRGLSQYGAYGYATDFGWDVGQILDHFYGGTTSGPIPASAPVFPLAVRVDLRFMIGLPTTVALDQGTIVVRGMDEAELARIGSGAVRARWVGDHYELDTGSSCGGPWTPTGTSISGRPTIRFQVQSGGAGSQGLLQACGSSQRTWYPSELRAEVAGTTTHTTNAVPVEQYLRGVVPNEMPSRWPAAALQAQAVAARSYTLAGDNRQLPYADTCDNTLCQVYDGWFTTRGGSFRAATAATSDDAIAVTADSVRLRGNGAIARTEFSSSSGGYSAGGVFPAVVDAGDATTANPNHNWSINVDLTSVEAAYNRGKLQAIVVVARNGLGADGGRATQVELRFERGTVTETAATVRSLLGLRSDWFTPGPVIDNAKRASAEGAYIDRSYQRLVGRPASDVEIDRWLTTIQQGNRLALTSVLVKSDYFIGRIVDDLYQRALGRAPDPDGRAYWIGQITRGLRVESTGVLFFGSPEYYQQAGGTNATFVTALYRGILGREPDPGGQAYWEGRLSSGVARPDDVAAGFYRSLESRRSRAIVLHQEIRGIAPSDAGRDILADRLLSADDLVVAAEIAASPEA